MKGISKEMAKKKSKAAYIREYAKAHPKAKNAEIVGALAKKGIGVTPSQVSTTLSREKKGKKSGSTSSPSPQKRSVRKKKVARKKATTATQTDSVSVAELKLASAFVKQIGDVTRAAQLVELVGQLT